MARGHDDMTPFIKSENEAGEQINSSFRRMTRNQFLHDDFMTNSLD